MTVANFEFILNGTRQTRSNMLNIMKPLSLAQLNAIPPGFRNNLIWNFNHVIVTQQLLCYGLSGLKPKLATSMIEGYRKGSAPAGDVTQEAIDVSIELCTEMLNQFQTDYASGLFQDFKRYSTSYGVELSRVEEAFQFNFAHEAMHLGTMIAMRKLV